MSSNFYKIEKEIHIDEILENNQNKLMVLVFSFENQNFAKNVLNESFKLKKYIKNNLKNDNDTIYLYIDLKNYIIKENIYSKYITKESLPYVSFYYNHNQLARILNCEQPVFVNTITKIKEYIHESLKTHNETNTEISNIQNDDKTEIKENEQQNLTDQIRQQRRLEEIEKLKQQYLINELIRMKKAKEIQEQIDNNA